jgi:hypothetical protein
LSLFFFSSCRVANARRSFCNATGRKYTKGVMLDMEYDPQPPYKAGSVKNTDNMVVDMMLEMYDMGLQPLIKAEDKRK